MRLPFKSGVPASMTLELMCRVSYTGGKWSGELATDIVSIVDSNQSRVVSTEAYIALIQTSEDFFYMWC